jgi:hypothetical protein
MRSASLLPVRGPTATLDSSSSRRSALPLSDDRIESLERLVHRRHRIQEMHLIKIDVVGTETFEGGIDRGKHVLARRPLLPRRDAHFSAALGRKNEGLAFSLQPFADDLLGPTGGLDRSAERVDVRRIQKCNACLRRRIQYAIRSVLVALQTKGHGAQAQSRHL